MMSPAPSRTHQRVSGILFNSFFNFLDGKPCEVYSAPFDVRLFTEETAENPDTVVQPDVVVICDPGKLDERGCQGPPDLVIEVVSPASVSFDYIKKLQLYSKYQVREY